MICLVHRVEGNQAAVHPRVTREVFRLSGDLHSRLHSMDEIEVRLAAQDLPEERFTERLVIRWTHRHDGLLRKVSVELLVELNVVLPDVSGK